MRKYFLSFVALAAGLFATSCQESIVEPQVAGPTTFTVQLPEQMGTKAIGDAENVNKLLVEVYPAGQESSIYQTVKTISQGKTTIELSLIQDQAYDILFWAQKNDGYVTVTDGTFGSLRNVPMNNKFSNNDNGAAFFHAEKGFVPTGASKEVKLRRPFAQLNLGTTTESLKTNAGNFELVSSQITITGVATSFDVFTGEGFGNANVKYVYESANVPNEDLTIGTTPNTTTYDYVSMNYLSVLGNEKDLVTVDATIVVKKGAEEQTITHTFTSVPVQENYRTNIVGNLISSTNDFNVIIDEGWDGEEYNYIAPGIKLVNGEYHIVSAEGLWSMAESLNASTKSTGHDLNGKTIKLAVDVDLQNKPWTPIKSFTNSGGKAIFDGQGHTIKNLNIENSYRGGIFEYVVGSIKNLNLDGVTITATRQAGAIVGQIYGNITDCSVNNVKITLTPERISENVYDNGDKVGALAGLVGGKGYSFTGNKATNVTLSAFRDLGGLIGAAHPSTITGNTLENITLIVNKTISYTDENGNPYAENANEVLGSQRGGASTIEPNNVTGFKLLHIDDSNNETSEVKAAVEAAEEGETVVIPDSYQGTLPTPKEKITIICEPGTVFEGTSSLNIKGSTLVGATFKNDNGSVVNQTTINGVFEDCTFDGYNGLRSCYAGETVEFINCVFDGDLYGVHFDGGANEVTFENCVFSGFNTFGAQITQLNIIGCTFKALGNNSYNGINMWGNTKLENCNFEFDGTRTEWIDAVHNNKTIELTDCKVNGEPLSGDIVGDYGNGNIIILDGNYFVKTPSSLLKVCQDVLSDSKNNVTIELGEDIDLSGVEWPAIKTSAAFVLDGKGKTIKNLKTSAVEEHGFSSTAMFSTTRKATTIKNLVIEGAEITGKGGDNSHGAFLVACNYAELTVSEVTVKNSTISNCDRTGGIVTYLYFKAATVENCVVEECTINSIGTAGAILGMNNSNNFTMKGCQVNKTTVSSSEGSNKAGIFIGTWQDAGTLTNEGNTHSESKAVNAGVETNNEIGRHA